MKKILISLLLSFWSIYSAPMVDVTDKELKLSDCYLEVEKIKREHIYQYTILVKGRYILLKKTPVISKKISTAIELHTSTFKYIQ